MNLPHVIGLAGPARVGKDTAANYIITQHPTYAQTSFAMPVKMMLMVGLNLTQEQVNGELKDTVDPRYLVTPRHLMQTLGTEWGRMLISPTLWLDVAHNKIHDHPTIFTDVRFEEEADFVREHGLLIHLTGRGGIDGDHASEAGVQRHNRDGLIYNSGSIKALHYALDHTLTHWRDYA